MVRKAQENHVVDLEEKLLEAKGEVVRMYSFP